jgi:hypothetical protein
MKKSLIMKLKKFFYLKNSPEIFSVGTNNTSHFSIFFKFKNLSLLTVHPVPRFKIRGITVLPLAINFFYFIVFLLLFSGCEIDDINKTDNETENFIFTDLFDHVNYSEKLTDYQLYMYPAWLDGCDRFRPIFLKEIEKYDLLKLNFDISLIYSLAYQESMCKTNYELKDYKESIGVYSQDWKGGIMQVDACWRWGSLYNCEKIQDQIKYGLKELNFSYSKILEMIEKHNLTKTLTKREKESLFLISYNRGYYVVRDALKIYIEKYNGSNYLNYKEDSHIQSNEFDKETIIQTIPKNKSKKIDETKSIVFVNCTEKDVCMNDYEEIDIKSELQSYNNSLEKSLLISCRKNYGYMKNDQGDYCTGEGYGLNYPKSIFRIYDKIEEYQKTKKLDIFKEKEFYIGEINFSNYSWFIKKSIGKTGPGPNFFYYDNSSLYVDDKGFLNMNVIKRDEKWYSSEIVLTESLGYGKYEFLLDSKGLNFDKNLVLGFFTYDLKYNFSDSNYFHREIDFEVSRWGYDDSENSHFAIQGELPLKAIKRFNLSEEEDLLISFEWKKEFINFKVKNFQNTNIIQEWYYNETLVPKPGDETIRFNFWIYNNTPSDLQESSIIIKQFKFTK